MGGGLLDFRVTPNLFRIGQRYWTEFDNFCNRVTLYLDMLTESDTETDHNTWYGASASDTAGTRHPRVSDLCTMVMVPCLPAYRRVVFLRS